MINLPIDISFCDDLLNLEHLKKCERCRGTLKSLINLPQTKMIAGMLNLSDMRDELSGMIEKIEEDKIN